MILTAAVLEGKAWVEEFLQTSTRNPIVKQQVPSDAF